MTDATTHIAEPFIDGLFFGECPRWHEGRLWYSDFFDHCVSSVGVSGDVRKEVDVPSEPAGLGWLPDGRLLIASRLERAVLRQEADGSLVEHASLKPWATGHANDMVVDAHGRAYCGNFGFDLDALFAGGPDAPAPTPTSLIRVDPDGSVCEAAPDIAFPNGTVILPDGETLVIAETFGLRLTAFTIANDGSLSNRRPWAQLDAVIPDGICLDEEGCIWVANAMGNECVRVRRGGEVVERVTTPSLCFACMLGGDDRRTLYCIVAETADSHIARAERKGGIVTARVDVPGAGLP